jgi:sRNA-binding regulator protein Hfq
MCLSLPAGSAPSERIVASYAVEILLLNEKKMGQECAKMDIFSMVKMCKTRQFLHYKDSISTVHRIDEYPVNDGFLRRSTWVRC